MRYTQSEKMEIIRIVEESPFSVKHTLLEIGVSRSTFYEWYKRYQERGYEGLRSHNKSPRQIWNKIPEWEKQRALMFSCKTRGFCPSYHAKRRKELLLDVPHRQVVFTVPRMPI